MLDMHWLLNNDSQWNRQINRNDSVKYSFPITYNQGYVIIASAGYSSSTAAEQSSGYFYPNDDIPDFSNYYIITYLNNSGSSGVWFHTFSLGI